MRILTLTAVIAVLALASCKKDFVCECKSSNGSAIEKSTIHTTHKKATGACSDLSAQHQHTFPGATCTLR